MSQSHSATGTLMTAGGCGCGCGGSTAGHGCTCRKADCHECQTPVLVRPRFFAGQLLTEEDLETLTSYVVAKQRLHARHLHGSGVVCGLEVTCDPCGGGRVVVQPGYALDCCGNDIVVPCPEEIDVLALIRRLQLDARGRDCGDPCKDMRPKPSNGGGDVIELPDTAGPRPRPDRDDDDRDDRYLERKYCLYVRYCEQGAEPVKPYVLDEPCGDAGCEHTRVREGYRFELRCPEDVEGPPTLLDRLRQCADPKELDKEIAGAEWRSPRFQELDAALQTYQRKENLQFTDAERELAEAQLSRLREFAHKYAGLEEEKDKDEEGEEPGARPEERELRETLDAFLGVSRALAKLQAIEAKGEEGEGTDVERAVSVIGRLARNTLENAAPVLRRHLSILAGPDDIRLAEAALEEGLRWTGPDLDAVQRLSPPSLLFIAGALQPLKLSQYDVQQLAQLRDWLLRRVGAGVASDCYLRRDIERVRIDADVARDPQALAALRRTVDGLLRRYIIACFCHALLPPCPPCDDTAVLLACLTVVDCKVVDICNLERTFVLSWPAMRYWIPWFGAFGELFEEICCPSKRVFEPIPPDTGPFPGRVPGRLFVRAGETAHALEQRGALESAVYYAAPSSTVAPALARLTQLIERSAMPLTGEVPTTVEAVAVPEGEQLAEALKSPAPRRLLGELIAERVDELRPQADLKAISDALNERLETVASSVSQVKRELKRRPTTSELGEVRVFKRLATSAAELRDANKRLEKQNEELAARLDAMAKRVEQLEAR